VRGEAASTQPSGFRALSGQAARVFTLPADLRLARSFPLEAYGLTYERYEQYFGSARVAGGDLTVYRGASGEAALVIGSHFPGVTASNSVEVGAGQAREYARAEVGAGAQASELMIDPASGRYFYRVETKAFGSRWIHSIDAESGAISHRYNAIATDHGLGVKGDTKSMAGLTTFHNASGHGSNGAHYDLFATDNRQLTYDGHNTPTQIFFTTDSNNHWDLVTANRRTPGQPALVDAHYYAKVSDDYLLGEHGLDWIGDCGYAGMQSVAHHQNNYDNAFWDGTYTVYGDGDGTFTREFDAGIDVVAHEHGHGVTECTSNLIYEFQPGALNESFSDIIGESAEHFANEPLSSNCTLASGQTDCADWWLAEDIVIAADTKPGFRNMADPEEDADPDHFTEFLVTQIDNGGVHTNSAIPNHAYFLLVNGGLNASCAAPGSHNSAHCSDADTQDNNLNVTAIGLNDAQSIFFLGFTGLAPNASFCNARVATEAAANTLFGSGSQQRLSTTDAWVAAGVTDLNCSINNTPPTAAAGYMGTTTNTAATVTLNASDAQQCELTFLLVSGPAHGSLGGITNNACVAGTPRTDSATVTYTPNSGYTGPDSFTFRANDGSMYSSVVTISISVFVDDLDDDDDLVYDVDEQNCGGVRLNAALRPERVDAVFAGVSDDGDALVDEALPAGAENFDCDGDGYKGSAESPVFAGSTTRDQDACGVDGWPADISAAPVPPDSFNRVNIRDLQTFIIPRRLGTSPGDEPEFDVRWDLVPGAGLFTQHINIADMQSMTFNLPPMLGGAMRAFNGPVCPWAP